MATQDSRETPQAVTPQTIARTGEADSPFAAIVAYFAKEHTGHFLLDEEQHTIHWFCTGAHGSYLIWLKWDKRGRRLLIRLPQGVTVPPDKRTAAAVLINLINYRLVLGNFEMNPSGEVAFRSSMLVADGTLGNEQVACQCHGVLTTADYFMPAFLQLVWADASPEEAFQSVVYPDECGCTCRTEGIGHGNHS
jgi:hypothetical protein